MTRSASAGPATSRPGAPANSTPACGLVRSSVASGLRCTPDAEASTAYRATPSAPRAATSNSSAAPPSTTPSMVPVSASPSAVTVTSPSVPATSGTTNAAVRLPSTSSANTSSRAAPADAATRAGIDRNTVPNSGPHASDEPSSSTATAWSTRVPPTPPSASGTESPSTPSSPPSRAHTLASNGGSDSIRVRTVCSSKFSVQNLRTAARSWLCSSVNVNSTTGDLLPRHARVRAKITRQAEDPLAQDVAHDFRRAAFDGVGAAAQEPLLDGTLPVLVPDATAAVVAVVQNAFRPKEIHAELVNLLVEFGSDQFADRALRPGTTDTGRGA